MTRLSRGGWVVCSLLASMVVLDAQVRELPAGWIRAGNKPAEYEMAIDGAAGRSGGAAFIKAKTATPTADGFGTLMQQFTGEQYRGKRLRLSAYIKTSGIANWAGLWMRVDSATMAPLAFDNMQDRPIKGTADWKRYEVVLDVPTTAVDIAFGILLSGPGQAWLDDVQFEVVGNNVPTTDQLSRQAKTPSGPQNLSFDK